MWIPEILIKIKKIKVMEVLELVDKLSQDEVKELLGYLAPLNEAGLIKEFIYKVDPDNIGETMYWAYYDLMIDSETGKWKPEFENLFPSTGKDPIY
jgi:hypothetical protein